MISGGARRALDRCLNSGTRGTLPTALTFLLTAAAGPTRGAETTELPVSPQPSLPDVVVIAPTPVPGSSIDADKFPGNVQILSSGDLTRQGTPSLTSALNANLGSISVNDNLDDPFQPDILYRGFEASPVLGTPQGLAVYQNGVRINEAFGDTVNWDLFPDVAISQVQLVSASPLYGRNALGGAIAVSMKNGFTYQGAEVELAGGSFGNRSTVAQAGLNSGTLGFYVAGKVLDWDGWRTFSSDRIRTLYASASLHSDRVTLDLSYTRADNTLNGQGSAPVQELAVSRSLVFTGPQSNINSLNFVTLNGTLNLSVGWSLQGVAYYRDYAQSVANGNTTNYASCANVSGILCQPDGVTPLTNASGDTLPDISNGGAIAIGENDFERITAWGRGVSLQISSNVGILGHGNQASLGAAVDDASTSFYSGAQIGIINQQLLVMPSNLIVYTPENSDAALANGDATPVSVNSVNRALGAFLTDTFDVTPALSVTASGRYNITRIDLNDQLGTNLSGNNRYAHFNSAFGGTYRILPDTTLYAGISTNARTPTASEIECSNPLAPCLLPTNLAGDPPNLRQVIAHTTEIGLRGRAADGRVLWNVGAFRTLLHDDIYGVATSVSQGFFQNIDSTRRQGIEAGLRVHSERWFAFVNYSFVAATFESSFTVPSPSNPFQDALGDIEIHPGDRLPGIPEHRLKLGIEYTSGKLWAVGATARFVSNSYYVGDEANLIAPLPGYAVVGIHARYEPFAHVELFASVNNLLNRKYSTWGILSDPTGVGAPGVPETGVDNRFQSPAAPFEAFFGVRLRL
jgi:outer membrane receptor protein involved in Fe transport